VALKTKDSDLPEGDLVHKSDVEESLTKIQKKEKFFEKLKKYSDSELLLKDFSINAVRAIIMEMEYGATSADRRIASEKILAYSMGKPIERVMSLSMESQGMPEEELDNKVAELLKFFGMSPHSFTAKDPNAAIYMDSPKGDSVDTFS